MEHRDGIRYQVEIPVYTQTQPAVVCSLGCLLNISITGGFLLTALPAELNSTISLRPIGPEGELPHRLHGQVVWRSFAGVGIVWSKPTAELIRTLTLTCESDDYDPPSTASGS
jgi:hypothetical protein